MPHAIIRNTILGVENVAPQKVLSQTLGLISEITSTPVSKSMALSGCITPPIMYQPPGKFRQYSGIHCKAVL